MVCYLKIKGNEKPPLVKWPPIVGQPITGGHFKHRFIPVYTGNMRLKFLADAQQKVYPCVYREHAGEVIIEEWAGGLSLCIQGTYWNKRFARWCLRFIPVYTGNMSSRVSNPCDNTVYPCVYREHPSNNYQSFNNSGLSLCIQGTFKWTGGGRIKCRFIPVCTGNIITDATKWRDLDGLSLCVQGTSHRIFSVFTAVRFIPVCIGNINPLLGIAPVAAVYPCVYREHLARP